MPPPFALGLLVASLGRRSMADLHAVKRAISPADIEMISLIVSAVSGSLGLLAMIASRVEDDEMVVNPHDFKGMMDTMQGGACPRGPEASALRLSYPCKRAKAPLPDMEAGPFHLLLRVR
ncbi:MAG: hypothetical protein HC767_05310 [Akkermansiaceae bacterium]|nr:hypothetical protein [Akkermansiaceae bacterium]